MFHGPKKGRRWLIAQWETMVEDRASCAPPVSASQTARLSMPVAEWLDYGQPQCLEFVDHRLTAEPPIRPISAQGDFPSQPTAARAKPESPRQLNSPQKRENVRRDDLCRQSRVALRCFAFISPSSEPLVAAATAPEDRTAPPTLATEWDIAGRTLRADSRSHGDM